MKGSVFTFFVLLIALVCTFGVGCQPKKTSSDEVDTSIIKSGDIIVSNGGSDSVLLFDSSGNFKDVVFELNAVNGEAIFGISENTVTGEILIAVDGTPDRIIAVKKSDLSSREFIRDTNLTGNIRGITYLTSGETLVVETSNVEKFDSAGYRVTTGSWPKALQTTGTGLDAVAGGGFIHCSTGSDVIRTYDASGTQLASAASGIAGTTDVVDCKVAPDGGIVVAFAGTTDTIRKYSADLSTTIWSYSSLSVLGSPLGLAVKSDGNILVLDSVLNHVLEISFDGTTATGNIFGGHGNEINTMLSTPQFIWVVK